MSQILPFETYCCSKLNVENVLGQILLVLLTKTFVRPTSPKSILTEKKKLPVKQFERYTSSDQF